MSFSESGDLRDLQDEVSEWALKNFGEVPSWMPLLGICEELGELAEARSQDDAIDAAADTIIFLANFCGRAGIDLSDAVDDIYWNWDKVTTADLLVLIGKMQHHYLKLSQGIRSDENHLDQIIRHCGLIYAAINDLLPVGISLITELQEIWPKVQKRDWRKDPNTAHIGAGNDS